MNLPLDTARAELLDVPATVERRTETEIVNRETCGKADKSSRTRATFARIVEEDAKLLDELSM